MEILNNLWIALTTENETLINLISIPLFFVENYLILQLFIVILHINSSKKQQYFYVVIMSIVGMISQFLLPSPFNALFNYIIMFLFITIYFKLHIILSTIATIIPTLAFALIGTLILKPFLTIFNITYEMLEIIPLYKYTYFTLNYIIIYFIILLCKNNNFKFYKLKNFSLSNKSIIFINITVTLFILCINLLISAYYTDILPIQITYCNFIALIVYLGINIYSLTRAIKLSETTIELENAEAYNRTLTILHDNVRCFRHDFNNIVTTIGGYIKTDDIEGLKKYYNELEKDCKNVNNIASLNPNLINNPGIYNLLTAKYNKANSKSVEINLEITLDLQTINMKIYDFSKILGILLDNAIEASSECEEKIVNIKFRHNEKDREQILIIENTYIDKNIDTNLIFHKGISSKNNHSGLGLWEINKIISKNNNIVLHTNNNDKYFTQELIIHY